MGKDREEKTDAKAEDDTTYRGILQVLILHGILQEGLFPREFSADIGGGEQRSNPTKKDLHGERGSFQIGIRSFAKKSLPKKTDDNSQHGVEKNITTRWPSESTCYVEGYGRNHNK